MPQEVETTAKAPYADRVSAITDALILTKGEARAIGCLEWAVSELASDLAQHDPEKALQILTILESVAAMKVAV